MAPKTIANISNHQYHNRFSESSPLHTEDDNDVNNQRGECVDGVVENVVNHGEDDDNDDDDSVSISSASASLSLHEQQQQLINGRGDDDIDNINNNNATHGHEDILSRSNRTTNTRSESLGDYDVFANRPITVRFACTLRKHDALSLQDYTEEELRGCWYTSEEKRKHTAKRDKIIARMEAGKPTRNPKFMSYRGLEAWTEEGSLTLEAQIAACIDAVMDEQDSQWLSQKDDHQRIAEISRKMSERSEQIAHDRAMQDREEAIQAWESDEDDGDGDETVFTCRSEATDIRKKRDLRKGLRPTNFPDPPGALVREASQRYSNQLLQEMQDGLASAPPTVGTIGENDTDHNSPKTKAKPRMSKSVSKPKMRRKKSKTSSSRKLGKKTVTDSPLPSDKRLSSSNSDSNKSLTDSPKSRKHKSTTGSSSSTSRSVSDSPKTPSKHKHHHHHGSTKTPSKHKTSSSSSGRSVSEKSPKSAKKKSSGSSSRSVSEKSPKPSSSSSSKKKSTSGSSSRSVASASSKKKSSSSSKSRSRSASPKGREKKTVSSRPRSRSASPKGKENKTVPRPRSLSHSPKGRTGKKLGTRSTNNSPAALDKAKVSPLSPRSPNKQRGFLSALPQIPILDSFGSQHTVNTSAQSSPVPTPSPSPKRRGVLAKLKEMSPAKTKDSTHNNNNNNNNTTATDNTVQYNIIAKGAFLDESIRSQPEFVSNSASPAVMASANAFDLSTRSVPDARQINDFSGSTATMENTNSSVEPSSPLPITPEKTKKKKKSRRSRILAALRLLPSSPTAKHPPSSKNASSSSSSKIPTSPLSKKRLLSSFKKGWRAS